VEAGANKTYEAFVRNFKSASAGHLLEVSQSWVVIRDQVAVQVIGQVGLWNLVPDARRIGDAIDDRARN
jgi:hypothetical protein